MILRAIQQHSSNPDWYTAQLINAITCTSSIEEAITLADAAFEAEPEPPDIGDEHESAALEELDEQLTVFSDDVSMSIAMASEDWRGVEHRGKGSSKGGQFVQHGMGEADVEDIGDQSGPPDVELVEDDAIDLPDSGLPDPNPFNKDETPDVEDVTDTEVVDVGLVDEAMMTPEYNDHEEAAFNQLVSFYSPEKQAIAKSLRYTPAVSINNITAGMQSEGIDPTKRMALEDGNRGIFKSQRGEAGFQDGREPARASIPAGTYYKREIMASIAADIWGFGDLVPVTVERGVGSDRGSMQHFVENAVTGYEYGGEENMYGSDEDLARAAIFDYVFGATDRKPDNWMVKRPEDPVAEPPANDSAKVVQGSGYRPDDPTQAEDSDAVIDFASATKLPSLPRERGDEEEAIDLHPPTGRPKTFPNTQYPPPHQPTGAGARIDLLDENIKDASAPDSLEGKSSAVDRWVAQYNQKMQSSTETLKPQPGKKALIDSSLGLPIHAGSEGFYHTFILARAVSDNLPMPDVSAMRETWPQTEAAMRAGGIEEQAISLLKERFDEATSGRAKTIGELKSPHTDSPGTIRDHLALRGKLNPPRKGRGGPFTVPPEEAIAVESANVGQESIKWPGGEPAKEEPAKGGIWNWLLHNFGIEKEEE